MSFSSTPLGQGRRLDHNSFLRKQPLTTDSYAPPSLGSRSPPRDTDNHLLNYHRQQREAELRGIITSPPKPEKWSVKDTSVNIATAFTQAATSDMSATYNDPNRIWAASGSRQNTAVPRSTSVEYESHVPHNPNRRLPVPPDRLARTSAAPTSSSSTTRKPNSKSFSSLLQVPDLDSESTQRGSRARSPLDGVIDHASRLMAHAAFYVRPRSHEPEDNSLEQQQPSTNGHPNTSAESYDYGAEDQQYKEAKAAKEKRKRARIPTENMAYRPNPESESDDDNFDDDDKGKRRRRKLKKGPVGGPLTTLPVLAADKRKKKRASTSKGNADDVEEYEEESDEETQDQISESRLAANKIAHPPLSRSRVSEDPPGYSGNHSMDMAEQGLESIPEAREEDLPLPSDHPTTRNQTSSPRFSIGAILGTIVNLTVRLILKAVVGSLSLLYLIGHVFGILYDTIFRRPLNWLNSVTFRRYFILALTIASAWYLLQDVRFRSYLPGLPSRPRSGPFIAPDLPAADIAEIADRLLKIETALSSLSSEAQRTKARADDGVKGSADAIIKVGSLETKLTKEQKRLADAEAKAREELRKMVGGVLSEVEVLQSQIDLMQQQKQQPPSQPKSEGTTDEDARSKLRLLEGRIGDVEGSVKEALELGKKAAAQPAASSPSAAWWTKLASGSSKTDLQIKSTDGQDVTGLIHRLVDNAVSLISKDGIAKPDFAMHSGGARVIPSITSPTFEVRPRTVGRQVVGLLTGSGYAVGRPPITALHHELHNGHCWPMEGAKGQLGVALAAPVFVDEVTIDHVPQEVAYDLRSAPRDMEVWGLVEGRDNVERVKAWRAERAQVKGDAGKLPLDAYDEEGITYPPLLSRQPEFLRLANFTYDIHAARNVQTFPVHHEIRDLGVDFGIVLLRVLSNWGREEFTCLYRFRVHGRQLGEIPDLNLKRIFGEGS